MKYFVCNSFSLNMVPFNMVHRVKILPIDSAMAAALLCFEKYKSYIGHKDTAVVISDQLSFLTGRNISVEFNRGTFIFPTVKEVADEKTALTRLDGVLLVAQYVGERLPEGATRLPEGANINYYIVGDKDFIDNEFSELVILAEGLE